MLGDLRQDSGPVKFGLVLRTRVFVLKLLLVEAAALSTEGKVVWGMGRGGQGISG